MSSTGYYRIMVAIETDATRYYGANAKRPALLGGSDSEQLLAHLAADLKSMLPSISQCSLIAPGAVFDQTQVLRPSYPVFRALESASTVGSTTEFRPAMVSIPAKDHVMPHVDLQPLSNIPLGLLQLLPVLVHGPHDVVAELGQAMEYRFLEEGQLSAHSAKWMETAFGVSINHARFMTLTDLNAMLQLQLENFGFLPMWQLLDAALSERADTLQLRTDSGLVFEWRDNAVHADFETFDYWANIGGGREKESGRQILAEAYGNWTRESRQYLTTLRAHGVTVNYYSPGDSENPLEGAFTVQTRAMSSGGNRASVTEHSYSEMGTIAVSLVMDGELHNYYPLSPAGLNEIHAVIRERVPSGVTLAFPGTILYDEKNRHLKADTHAENR